MIIDGHKLHYHPERVAEYIDNGICSPIYVEIGITNKCNHNCTFCALDFLEDDAQSINEEALCKAAYSMWNMGVKSVCFAGEGEPFIGPLLLGINAFHTHEVDTAIMTNGSLLHCDHDNQLSFTAQRAIERCEWIRISVNGDRGTYKKVHGADDYDRVLLGLKEAADHKKKVGSKVTLGVQCIVLDYNISDIITFTQDIKRTGVDNIQFKPYSQHPQSKNQHGRSNITQVLKAQQFQDDNFKVIVRNESLNRIDTRTYTECHGINFIALICANGDVIPCNMYYGNEEYTYGNINNNYFDDIWYSPRAVSIRNKIKLNGVDNCRPGCRCDAINRYLDHCIHLDKVKHLEFI